MTTHAKGFESCVIATVAAIALVATTGLVGCEQRTPLQTPPISAQTRLSDLMDPIHANANESLRQVLRDAPSRLSEIQDYLARRTGHQLLPVEEVCFYVAGFAALEGSPDWPVRMLGTDRAQLVRDFWLYGWVDRVRGEVRLCGEPMHATDWDAAVARVLRSFPVHQRGKALFYVAENRAIAPSKACELISELNPTRMPIGTALLCQGYLYLHSGQANVAFLSDVLARACPGEDSDVNQTIVSAANRLPPKLVVPWLVQHFVKSGDQNAREALKALTFQLELETQEQWSAWFAKHGREEPTRWRQARFRAIDRMVGKDLAQAQRMLKEHFGYGLRHPDMIKWLERWARHGALREMCLQLLAEIAFEFDAQKDVRLVVNRIVHGGPPVRTQTRQWLERRGVWPRKQPSWKEIITAAFSNR